MMFAQSARAYKARPDSFARQLFAPLAATRAKLIVSLELIGFLSGYNFRLIDHHNFAMRCFPRPLGGPRQPNTRGGES